MTETKAPVRPSAVAGTTAGTSPLFRPDIEGLRAVAIILIVLCHTAVPGVGGGYLGAGVFFVITGFLVTATMLGEIDRTGRLALLDLAGRRCRRILPVVSLVLTTVLLVNHDDPAPLRHLGPLAELATFSVVAPLTAGLLIWLGFRWALGWFLAAAVAASFVYGALEPASRVGELGAGCLFALVGGQLHRIPRLLATATAGIGLAGIVVAALTFETAPTFGAGLTFAAAVPGHATVLVVVATVLVLAGRGDAVLGWAPLQYLGRLAFPLYLWHWPVLVLAEQAYGGPLPPGPRAVLVLVSLALATVTYVCVEEPIRRSGRLTRSPLLTAAVVLLLIAAPLAATNVHPA